ncbi:aminoacyl-tRNA hydrolase [Effusibacillus pohliae]|uniref:aminoacyl-tRNA hydrolase n=1 Tax=Effusibacillus pohliae TaxID=232270 RepID=UPI0003771E8A|nr:aminoacyl-tRNA hydrolase [Effusibacillus pohliae]
MRIVIGLGNPGKEYEGTRHNVGFMVIDELANALGIDVRKSKCQALYGEGTYQGEKIVLVKPMTYMNLSGQAVRQVLDWYKPDASEWVVVYDDMDLPLGKIRLRVKGGAGGHNGIKSIISCVGTQDFLRIRVGIDRPDPGVTVVDHVLSAFCKEQRPLVEQAIRNAASALQTYIEDSFQTAMNRHNS